MKSTQKNFRNRIFPPAVIILSWCESLFSLPLNHCRSLNGEMGPNQFSKLWRTLNPDLNIKGEKKVPWAVRALGTS